MGTAKAIDQRWLGAAFAAIALTVRGSESDCTQVGLFRNLELACGMLQVSPLELDDCAQLLDYHYYRPWDCYLSRRGVEEARKQDQAFNFA